MLKGLQTGAVFRKSVSQYGSKGLKMFMPSVPAVLPLGIFPEKYSFFMAAKFLKQSNCPKTRNDRNDGITNTYPHPLLGFFVCLLFPTLSQRQGFFLVLSIIMGPITIAPMNQMPILLLPLQAACAWVAQSNGS